MNLLTWTTWFVGDIMMKSTTRLDERYGGIQPHFAIHGGPLPKAIAMSKMIVLTDLPV